MLSAIYFRKSKQLCAPKIIICDFLLSLFCSNERNVIEAAAKGASTAIALVANIAANLIAFLAFLAFFNGVLSWLGSMVGRPETSFEVGCGVLFLCQPSQNVLWKYAETDQIKGVVGKIGYWCKLL